MKLIKLPTKVSILVLLLALFFTPNVFAAALSLDSIGVLSTNGNKYSSWWYNGNSPKLSGKGTAGATVTVTIDSTVAGTATVAADETWSLNTTLADGDHNVVIESGSESYAFTLSLNNASSTTAVGSTSPATATTTVPDTGSNQVFALGIGTSLILLGYYFYRIQTSTYRKKNFESDVLDSLK